MRQAIMASTLALTAALAVTGCTNDNTGDVGHKNLRPYYANEYEKNGIPLNGIHSPGALTYRTRFASDQSNERNRRMGRDGLGNNIIGPHDNYQLERDNAIEARISKLPEVAAAYVMMADHNAYVGIEPRNAQSQRSAGQQLDARVKDKAADLVKAMSPRTQNVYVTSHPEFIGRMQSYGQAAEQGETVQSFLTEFNALVERIFPGARQISGTDGSGNRTGLSSDTGTDTDVESGNAFTGRYK